ncbi:hypothetical protein M911_08075 [Ectothiorhodospira haloalkaliphila]|uniref:Uncharacterized protein n=1 Tax=Ectothiorhodospira haloalkaliphila TaxID=421628 RepID=W8KH91_9GAMM|nr:MULTISPECIES: hypothetical protein [Ectothiorhodospira]AHK79119.1 hypothetical protein M911_08075 [Ectothiorhodospira haloalkaliphila]MCG5494184.1 hypothetical protein [Ectothiorhodospira variabilis]MCG5497415.1 hypothetical protein [Ectothiorhodospira variabilis]MCG5503286.1 hypothetical protein [Ectothiorhodospira variabilis]MCG5506626.1 hypothetical protein [Ectothiorhodospira variabilis]
MLDRILARHSIDRQQFQLGALVLFTGLVLTLQNPDARDSAAELISHVEMPSLSNIMEMRPSGPPPWMDSDQFLMEDAEEIQPALATLDRDQAVPAGDLRERPQR